MCVKIQHHLKRLSSRKITQCILQVVSSITANIQCFVKIQRRWKLCGILPMTKLDILGRIRQSTTATSVDLMENLLLQVKGLNARSVKIIILQTCDVVKRTCGYLGNPQTRPMVHGRHVEISSRVKHMQKLKERYALGVTEDE